MEASFLLTPEELTIDFLEGIKKSFSGRNKLRINIETEMDETEYVMKYQGESIKKAEENLREGKFTSFNDMGELKAWLEKETGTLID